MVTQNFQWAAQDERSFDERFFKDIRLRHPDIVDSMENNWSLTRDQTVALHDFAMTSAENHLAVCLHLLVYADDDSKFKDAARERVQQFLDVLYQQNDYDGIIEFYEDGISDFLAKNKAELQRFTQFSSSWTLTPILLDKAFKKDGGNQGGQTLLLGYDPK